MNLRRRLLYALVALLFVLTASVIGYKAIGGPEVTFLQALYMAVITLAGVGYGEIIDTSHNPGLRIFNIFVVLVGVAITVYAFSVLTAFLVEGSIRNIFWRRRMQHRIAELKDHFIVCGLGDTGRYCVEELLKTETPFVAVDVHADNVRKLQESLPDAKDLLFVVGDAADAAVLEQAGITRAHGLLAALPSDKDNLVITVVARQQNSSLRIVSRCTDLKFAERLTKAGANATVSPNHIGGLRMASEALRPSVVSFLDQMLKEKSHTIRVEEISVPQGGAWVGLTINDIDLRGKYQLLPLAIKFDKDQKEQKFVFAPGERQTVSAGSVIVVMGEIHDVKRARNDAEHRRLSSLSTKIGS